VRTWDGREVVDLVTLAVLPSRNGDHRIEKKDEERITGGLMPSGSTSGGTPILLATAGTAEAVLRGVEADEEDIFPDPMSRQLYAEWTSDHQAVERQFAAM
jgi:hypothetical protein